MTIRTLSAIRALRVTSMAVLIGAASLLAGCSGNSGDATAPAVSKTSQTPEPAAVPAPKTTPETKPAPKPTETVSQPPPGINPGGGALITFERISHEFGMIPDTAKARTTFAFTNTGSSKLIIESVKGSCGCTVPTLARKQFMPGEGDEIVVVFDPKGRPGTQTKTVTVTSNASPERTTTLKFTAQVEPLLKLKQRFVRMDKLPVGIEHKKLIEGTYVDPDLTFTNVSLNQPWGSARLLEYGEVVSAEGEPKKYGAVFELTINADAPWGTLFATRMSIDVSAKPDPDAAPVNFSYEVFLQGQLFGEIEAYNKVGARVTSPSSILSLGRVDQGKVLQKNITLRRVTDLPFEVLSAEVTETTMDGVTATVTKVNESQYDILITAKDPTFKGLVRGIVTVSTNVEGEESLPVRFTGSFK